MSQKHTSSIETVLDAESLAATFPKYDGQLRETAVEPASEADTVPAEDVLPTELADALETELYSHQAAAIRKLREGRNVSVATSTSSGKTWVYALYYALRKLENPNARALFLYPTKALGADQEVAVNELFDRLDLDARAETYDGDTPADRRRAIRNRVDVPISNFAGINAYLDFHAKWRDVFANCEVLVVDEAHTYSGVHGMHVSWVLRRLRRLLDYYDADPRIVCTTATIGNPREHAESLTGAAFDVVDQDGSPHGRREIAFWEPPARDPDDALEGDETPPDARASAADEAANVMAHLTKHERQTLLFSDSRQGTEIGVKRTLEAASDHPADTAVEYAPYHAGLSTEKRTATERALRTGAVDGVVTTSALELGVDIGSMDATVLTGYPGTRQSFWQRIGRAGRGTADSLSVYVPGLDAIDRYVLDNPDYLLEDDVEEAVVDLSNDAVYARHLRCAASERPLTYQDTEWFGPEERLERGVEMWTAAGEFGGGLERGVRYDGAARPQDDISLYATTNERYDVRRVDGEIDMEPLERERVYRQYHPGALVVYDGQQYEVRQVVEHTHRPFVELESVDTRRYTQAVSDKSVTDLEVERTRDLGEGYRLGAGTGTVHINYSAYTVRDIFDGTLVEAAQPIDLPPISLRTQLMWVAFPEDILERVLEEIPDGSEIAPDADGEFAGLGEAEYTLAGGLHGSEHGMIKLSPLELRLDTDDMGGLSQLRHPDLGGPGWFIHDAVEGGVGFAHGIYESFEAVAERTRDRIGDCDCGRIDGCPACLMSSQCGNRNEPLHRRAAVSLLEAALERARSAE